MGKNIYMFAKERISLGEHFNVNFETKTLKVGKEYLIKDGLIVNDDDQLGITPHGDITTIIDELEERFWQTQHCAPGRIRHESVFPQPKSKDLSSDDELFGDYYDSFFELEYTLLAYIIQGVFCPWDTEILGDGYFWRSKNYPKFVILRSWTEINTTINN